MRARTTATPIDHDRNSQHLHLLAMAVPTEQNGLTTIMYEAADPAAWTSLLGHEHHER